MCRLWYFYFLVFWLLTIIDKNYVRCTCKGSVVVFCESIFDLKYEPSQKKQSWEEVTIGNSNQIPHHAQEVVRFVSSEFYGKNVEKLTIINQFNSSIISFTNVRESLKSLTFYGNNMKKVKVVMTPYYKRSLDILSLHHNNIENIEFLRTGFRLSTFRDIINILDLSHNQLSSTDSYQFLEDLIVTKLILSNNKLTKIRSNCLPEGLKHLHLDHNQFVYFSTMNLNSHNCSQLEYLTVAHNKLKAIDDLPIADSLNNLDLSFNELNYIPDVFSHYVKLRTLNLRHNNLITFTFPYLNRDLKDIHFIDLAFNRLRNLDSKPVKNYTVEVLLFGNPWNCRCIHKLRNSELFGNRLVEKRPCDDRFADHVPYCVINDRYNEWCSSEAVSDDVFDVFRNVTRNFVDWNEGYCEV